MSKDTASYYENFSGKLRALERHAENLLKRAELSGDNQGELIATVCSELQISLEELRREDEESRM